MALIPRVNAAERRLINQGAMKAPTPQAPRVNAAERRLNNQGLTVNTQTPKQNPQQPATGGGVTTTNPQIPRAGSGFKLGTTLDELNAQRANTKGANRLAMIDNAIAGMTPQTQPTADTQPADNIQTMPGESVAPPPGSTFKTTYDFLPKNMADDPIYTANLARGNERINRLMAQRGLVKSGAEIEAQQNLERDLAADAYGRQIQTAGQDAGRFDEAQRYDSNYSANREDAQWDRMFRTTDMMLGQSPMQWAYQGTGQVSNLAGDIGNKESAYLRDKYNRVSAPKRAGVAGPGEHIPPKATGPDYSNIALLEALQGGTGRESWGDAIVNSLPSWINAFK